MRSNNDKINRGKLKAWRLTSVHHFESQKRKEEREKERKNKLERDKEVPPRLLASSQRHAPRRLKAAESFDSSTPSPPFNQISFRYPSPKGNAKPRPLTPTPPIRRSSVWPEPFLLPSPQVTGHKSDRATRQLHPDKDTKFPKVPQKSQELLANEKWRRNTSTGNLFVCKHYIHWYFACNHPSFTSQTGHTPTPLFSFYNISKKNKIIDNKNKNNKIKNR